jgi:predicted RNA-binding Zn ribbon-like protein
VVARDARIDAPEEGGRTQRAENDDGDDDDEEGGEGIHVADALACVASSIVAEIATGRPDRFRICANDTCRWAFYDESPTGRRRWCDMRTCGNRAKAARHRERLKAASAS